MKKLFILSIALVSLMNIQAQEENVRIAPKHKVGEHYGGGVIFFIYNGGEHGLIAATVDQDRGLRWFGGYNIKTTDGVGAGKKNTDIIVSYKGSPPDITFAAKLCKEYEVTEGKAKYDDWYLPSKLELSLMFMRRLVIGGFSYNYYWSSTIHDNDTWFQDFGNGRQDVDISMPNAVRAIRAF
jgi:hypothetical protein